jgi:dienelactone hydrolase
MRQFIFGSCCAMVLAMAQSQAQPLLTIDGALNDPLWKGIAPQQFQPSQPGIPIDIGGQVRAIVAGRYLCVAARLPEPTGRITARSIGRNPAWEDEDMVKITVGPDIGYTDRILLVNPLGAYGVEKATGVVNRSEPVYPYEDVREADIVYQNIDKFLVASRVGDKEWSVEAAFPLSEVSAPGPDHIYVRVERIRAQRPGSPQQKWHWPKFGPAARVPISTVVKWDAPPPAFQPPLIGNQEPPLEVGRAQSLPPASAGWDDAAWRDAPPMQLLRDEPNARLPRFSTRVKMLHDGDTLAVMARCVEPGNVIARVKENDAQVGRDDSFQIYLSTSGSTYVQVAANAAGYLLDQMGFSGGPRISRPREWDSGTRVTVRKEPGAWIARLDIPLAPVAEALGETKVPKDWHVLLMRFRPGRDGDPSERSVLPVIESDTPLCPARYRRLTLSNESTLPNTGNAAAPATAGPMAQVEARVLPAEQHREMNLAGMLRNSARNRIRKILEADRAEWLQVNSLAGWEHFRDTRLKGLRDFLGRFPERVPLHTSVTKEFFGRGYRRQDLVYQSRPGLWVTANLYLPEKARGRAPGIIIIHSHHRPRTQAELQDMGILWARAGCAVLIMDQLGHGERIQTYPWNREAYHSRYTMGMQFYLVGDSLIKWMVWDIMRGVDLLTARDDVDKDQIILLGAVAAGGDPAAVTAVLDSRIAAVAPFNFGEASPEAGAGESKGSMALAVPGSGSWETTRNLPWSIVDKFFPWTICASVAPRRFIYSYEMGWQVEKVPAWARYRKVFGFYDALDHLDEAHGFGGFPGPGECANIGPSQRKTLYPELHRWFGIPIPESEPDDRRPEAELAALNPVVASQLDMRSVHDLVHEIAVTELKGVRAELEKLDPQARRAWLRTQWSAKLGDVEPNRQPKAVTHWTKSAGNSQVEGVTLEVEPGIIVPLLLMRPAKAAKPRVVVIVSEDGKERILADRANEIEALLKGGAVVCLLDVRGAGETSPDLRRGPSSAEISLAATELMLGKTLLGERLKDLRTVLAWLQNRPELDSRQIAVWGDSGAPVNPPRLLLDETPGWQIGPEIEQQAEPLGGLLAILAALYEDSVHAVAVHRGLCDYLSMLEDQFAYIPGDVVVPGMLEAGDITDLAAALSPRPLLLEGLVDARNRMVSENSLHNRLASVYAAYRDTPDSLTVRTEPVTPALSKWLLAHL